MTDHQHSRLLRIYLEDHLAGSAAGVRRAQRFADAERDSPDGDKLARIAAEIEADRATLSRLIDHLGLSPRTYKQVIARAIEVIGLLILNGRLFRRSPLTNVVEAEAMLLAVRGKLAGWETMRTAFGTTTIGSVDLDQMVERARSQLDDLDGIHNRAAASTFRPLSPTG